MAAGVVSSEQADVIVRSVDALPSGTAVRARGEQTLLEHARAFDATDLARTGRHLVHVVDPDAEDRRLERQPDREERVSHLTRFLSIVGDQAGGVRLKGRGSAEDGALLKAALLPLTTPTPTDNGDHDHNQPGDRVHDPRDAGARMWDALVTVAQHALDTDLPPQSHSAPARVTVTTTLDQLRTGLTDTAATRTHLTGTHLTGTHLTATHLTGTGVTGTGLTGDGTQLSVSTLRRLACDAEIIPAVLGATGEPLDVGRTQRLVTPALWAALVLRDQQCAFPGCHRPPLMCHAHHITHWTNRGTTSLDNLVLLCGHHHRTIHHTPWKVRLNTNDRKPEFLPPPKPRAEPHWIRHRPRRE